MDKMEDVGGPVIQNAVIVPIFWGPDYTDPILKQVASGCADQMTHLCEGPYLRALIQYRGIRPAEVVAPVFDTTSSPPAVLQLADLQSYLQNLISGGGVLDFRDDDQVLYFVFTNNSQLTDGAAGGYHYWGQLDGKTFHFAWAIAPQLTIVSHEVVEACTDPEGNGFFQVEAEIEGADICQTSPQPTGMSDGVTASAYWSNVDNACVIPTRVAHIVISDPTFGACRVGPSVGSESTFTVSIGVIPDWIDSLNLPPLKNARYHWYFDDSVASAVAGALQSTLTLNWKDTAAGPTTVSIRILADDGRQVRGSLTFSVLSAVQADMKRRICRLRQLLDSERTLPIFWIDPLGPDAPELPTLGQLERLNQFARMVSQQVNQIVSLNKGTLTGDRTGVE